MAEKAVLVTGASGGIGSALVSALAERGWTVYAGSRASARAKALPTGPRVHPVIVDVTDPVSVTAAAEQVRQAQGDRGLQAVVNNAGIIVQGPVELVSDADLHRQFDVNVYGPVRVMRAFLPLLRAGGGRVINVSAASAQVAMPVFGPVSASKAALESLSAAARVELAAWGVPIVVVEPGMVATDIFAKAQASAEAALADVQPERLALYQPALDAFARTMARQRPGPATPTVRALVQALEARHPRARYVTGDARAMVLLARLPVRVRDRVLARATGLAAAPAPEPTPEPAQPPATARSRRAPSS